MRKIIAALNMTLDGVCDHTVGLPDEGIHNHYTALLNSADAILYGRITYELMTYWQQFLAKPTGKPSSDDFTQAIDRIQKIVFSGTLTETGWDSATLADKPLEALVSDLKKQPGRDILVGSRSLIVQLANLSLVDELQICIYPMLAGSGLMLFDGIKGQSVLRLIGTKTFGSGAVLHCYATAASPTP